MAQEKNEWHCPDCGANEDLPHLMSCNYNFPVQREDALEGWD